ncbi:hypothetical protein ACFL5B_02500 [Candidatus Latescibacterota bacterium]
MYLTLWQVGFDEIGIIMQPLFFSSSMKASQGGILLIYGVGPVDNPPPGSVDNPPPGPVDNPPPGSVDNPPPGPVLWFLGQVFRVIALSPVLNMILCVTKA